MVARVRRFAWFVLGIVLNSFGIALITKAALGTSPISSVPYVLSDALPLTFGQFTFVMNMLFILAQIVLLRRAYDPVQLLQILVNVVFSVGIDLSMAALSWLESVSIAFELVSLAAGCAILAFGISVEVASGVLLVPGEGIVKAIADTLHVRFGSVKVAFDLSLVALALLLSFAFFSQIDGLGLGTLVSALAVGRLVNLYNEHLPLVSHVAALKGSDA